MPNLDTNFRRTDEYKSWVKAIKADQPTLPDYLIDMAIFTHLADPQGYKQFWKKRIVEEPGSKSAPNSPTTTEVVGAVSVLDADDPSLNVPSVPIAAESLINVASDASLAERAQRVSASGLASDEAKN